MNQVQNFFTHFPIESILLEEAEQKTNASGVQILFLWGENCPNCEIAKKVLLDRKNEALELGKNSGLEVRWFHANVYENFEWAHRYGLQGIPHFIIFKNGRKIGRISPFPGWEPFSEAIRKVIFNH